MVVTQKETHPSHQTFGNSFPGAVESKRPKNQPIPSQFTGQYCHFHLGYIHVDPALSSENSTTL